MFKKIFGSWTIFEICLLAAGITGVTGSFFMGGEKNFLSLFTSLFGVVSVLFVAKGLIVGQYLTVVFTVLYAALSFRSAYYGESIIAACLMLPAALVAIFSWMKNPSEERGKVKVNKLAKREWLIMLIAVAGITFGIFFLLRALRTAELYVSTVSFVTSLSAAYLLIRRSPYYAIFYVLNDIILTILWSLAFVNGQNVLPSIVCSSIFLLNDCYGFIDWRRRARLQAKK